MLLGQAALAMWWDVSAAERAGFEEWHSCEHFPERMRVPGFLRGSRWASAEGGEGFFVMYELESYGVFTSPAYRERLDNPTPWSTKMMPLHRNMVRSQCVVIESLGQGIGGHMLTLRMSRRAGELPGRAMAIRGVTAAHLLHTRTPDQPQTTEQKIRGGDAAADWIVLVTGYDPAALREVASGELGPEAVAGFYALSHAVASRPEW